MTNLSRRHFLGAATATGAAAAATVVPGLTQSASAAGSKAATIIRNARVFVGDNANTMADAVAIGTDGRILAVGTNRQVAAYSGYGTEVIDAKGGTVMSGIHDGHVHPMYAGLRALNPSLEDAELSAAEVQDLVATFLADPAFGSEPDAWLTVEAWNPAGTPSDTLPHKDILDSLATSRPIALSGSDGHNTWVNSKALQIAGIDQNTPDPTGGEIVRDNNGEATGVLKDAAQGLVTQYIPEPTPEVMYDAFVSAFAQMAAGGITTVLDAWVEPWQLDFYAAMAENGHLTTRTFPALLAADRNVNHPHRYLAKAKELAATYGAVPNLHFGNIKIFMDGVIEYPAQTAALLKPYLDADGNPTDNFGDLYFDAEALGRFTRVFDAAGWQVHTHAIGDGAVRAALDGFEIARKANGNRRKRHTIAHLQLVHPADYARFAELNVVPTMQLQWATRNVWTMEALLPFIGEKRHARMYPAKSMLDAGCTARRWLRLAGRPAVPLEPGADRDRPHGPLRRGVAARDPRGDLASRVAADAHPRHGVPAAPGQEDRNGGGGQARRPRHARPRREHLPGVRDQGLRAAAHPRRRQGHVRHQHRVRALRPSRPGRRHGDQGSRRTRPSRQARWTPQRLSLHHVTAQVARRLSPSARAASAGRCCPTGRGRRSRSRRAARSASR